MLNAGLRKMSVVFLLEQASVRRMAEVMWPRLVLSSLGLAEAN